MLIVDFFVVSLPKGVFFVCFFLCVRYSAHIIVYSKKKYTSWSTLYGISASALGPSQEEKNGGETK